jgi:hypothetical protein
MATETKQVYDGGSAFPVQVTDLVSIENKPGMSLRDYFAGQALIGYLQASEVDGELDSPSAVAKWSYAYADAMLAARTTGGAA